MAIEGPLRELGLHDVFQLLDLSRKTGIMRVTSHLRSNEGLVAFDMGAIVYAEIRSNPFRLGELLLRTGRIAEADLERARTIQKQEGHRRLGQILVAIGALSQRELDRQVEFQITEVVFELLSWHEGFFSFTEAPLTGVPADLMVKIRTESLLMEGARRIDEWSRIESVVPHVGVVPVLAPGESETDAALLDLLPGEWETLALVDGERSVREIARGLGRSDFEVARTVFGLVTTGIVVLEDPGTEGRVRSSAGGDVGALIAAAEMRLEHGDAAAAREAAQAAASVSPGESRIHLVLARACLREGKVADAVEEGRRAVRLDPLSRDTHRWLGLALAAAGRFAEAEEQFAQWDRLADASVAPVDRESMAAAKAAVRTLAQLLGGVRG